MQQDFANFYAYLTAHVDHQIDTILGAMTSQQKKQTLIIRFADHGEMGLGHGMVKKFVNAYGQCMHVPLVFSNPIAWPKGRTTHQIAGPSVIRTIRSKDWIYSVYLDAPCSTTSGYFDADWEMYDLGKDPTEQTNLAGTGMSEQTTLDQQLQQQMIAKGTAPAWYPANWPPQATADSLGGPPPSGTGTIVHAVEKIPGITARQADALRYVGIHTTGELIARGADPARRKELVNLITVDEAVLENWMAAAMAMKPA